MSGAVTAESIREEAARRGVSLWQVRKDRGETRPRSTRVRTQPSPRQMVCLRLATELADRLRQEAEDRDVSVNWLATMAIENFLERLIPAAEFRMTR